ncbi:response regulator [Tenacibaculum piscium]|uniref:response regulator n=1 Tax=Tenacibaculum piscium TaxID=1458515 RepID=UPI001F1EB0BE|nr:response regulator [Tenacibaculum piscium]
MKLYTSLVNIGVEKVSSVKEKKRVRVLNLASYISSIDAIFFLFFDYFTNSLNTEKTITLLFEITIYIAIVFFQHKGYSKISRIIFTLSVFSVLFYHCNYAFIGYYGEYQYIVIPLFTLFFFDNKYIHYGSLILSVMAFYLPNLYWKLYPDQYFGYLNALVLFLGVFLIVQFFKKLNNKNERLLEIEKNKVLEDKVLLEEQQIALKELEQFKSHFFVNLSHEIRTPLTLIKGYASHIVFKNDDTENKQMMEKIQHQTQYIQNIVDNILDLSKLEENKLVLNTKFVSVSLLITKLYTDYQVLFQKKDISFEISQEIPQISIQIDEELFTSSLNNLLHNALKFTPKNGNVRINIIYDKNLSIEIIDTGIGIPTEDIAKIFTRFYQSKNHITKSQGSGIGLSFTKNLLEAHGFLLDVTSIPEKETIFKITIPTIFIQESVPNDDILFIEHNKNNENFKHNNNNSSLKVSPKSKKSILIVEDNEDMRDYLKLVLKKHTITEATNGQEALEILKTATFNTIITDYMMPVMDGLEFVKAVKKRGLKTPVIVITARKDDTGKLNMLRLGIDDYITKPFLEEQLRITITRSIALYDQINVLEAKIAPEDKMFLEDNSLIFDKQLKNYIWDNIENKNFGVDDLASLMNLSRSSVFRKTKLILGQTPNEVINEARLQKARVLLDENPSIRKKELADAVGVYNATYFYKKLEERFFIEN